MVRLPDYHPGQAWFARLCDARKTAVAVCGRRWGKTFFGARRLLDHCLMPLRTAYQGAWIAPSYDLTMECWRQFHDLLARVEDAAGRQIAVSNKQEHAVHFPGGVTARWRSSDNPRSLRARGYDEVFVDEAVWVVREAWEHAIRGSLADRDGSAVLLSTPGGVGGWFYEEFMRAELMQDRSRMVTRGAGGYAVRLPSVDNPSPKILAYVERASSEMHPLAFRQEFLAEFVEDLATLFRGLQACAGGEPEPPRVECHYVAGLDVARVHDWTVCHVLRLSGGPPWQLVAEDRYNDMDWPEQVERAVRLARSYNTAPLVVDDSGERGGVMAMLRQRQYPAQGFTFTEKSRRDLLDSLSLAVQEKRLRIPAAFDGLFEEMRSFGVRVDHETGKTKYASRSGLDDRVMALALACNAAGARAAMSRIAHGLTPEDRDSERRRWRQGTDLGGGAEAILREEF